MGAQSNETAVLTGEELRTAFELATRFLERHRDSINALNVFPVPDGDTGTNMLLTMRSVNEESSKATDSSAAAVASAMARGALLGARGNSGVILSQFFHGLAQGLHGKDEIDGEDLAQAFKLASRAADKSVSKPVDGTMLTVLRELSLSASQRVGGRGGYGDVLSVWLVALEAAKVALSRTPMQLQVLSEAGVVDAGGQGVVTILEGAWRCLSGQDVDGAELDLCAPVYTEDSSTAEWSRTEGQPAVGATVQEEYLSSTEDELYGYCTQLLIHGRDLDVDKIREELSAMAGSTVVVGDDNLVKLHVHAYDPGPIISHAVSLGTIAQVTMDNMDEQHKGFVDLHRDRLSQTSMDPNSSPLREPDGRSPVAEIGVLAVGWGEGIVRLFNGLGCGAVVAGGQTMNPSAGELLDAAGDVRAKEVILLPNNPNIIPAARQAASIRDGASGAEGSAEAGAPAQGIRLHVIPSRTIPQGVAALLAFNPEGDLDSNLDAMDRALATVKTLEVTRAVRPASLGGVTVEEGQYIGLLEGEMVVAAGAPISALQQTLAKLEPTKGQLVTLYWGADMQESDAGDAAAILQEVVPGIEVEVVYGGQPLYHYIASLE